MNWGPEAAESFLFLPRKILSDNATEHTNATKQPIQAHQPNQAIQAHKVSAPISFCQ